MSEIDVLQIGMAHLFEERCTRFVDDCIAFLKGCDTIVHEAQYFPSEYPSKIGWGHSSMSNAAVLIKHTGCKDWIVTHHDPQHVDATLQKKLQMHKNILEDCQIDADVTMAYDGLLIPL